MVVTKVSQIKSARHLKRSVRYILDEAKTMTTLSSSEHDFSVVLVDGELQYRLVSGHLIGAEEQAATEFLLTKKLADQRFGRHHQAEVMSGEKVLAHHLVQSFSPDDKLSLEEIHAIGRQTILELTGGRHEFVMATHIDKGHVHNHIIFNSTDSTNLKKFRWQKGTKKSLEKISDRHADLAGAKVLDKTNKLFDRKAYLAYRQKHVFKVEITSRLEFLLKHSMSVEDFKAKAKVLQLEVDFSRQSARYRLLDQPQERYRRDDKLSKTGRYSLEQIAERVAKNEATYGVDEIRAAYDKEEKVKAEDFELRLPIKPWQIEAESQTGIYLSVDYGLRNHGLIKIPHHQIEKDDQGQITLFIKKRDFFYFLNPDQSANNRFMTGETLMKQLAYDNGEIVLHRNSHLSKLDRLIKDYEFLARHEVTNSEQFAQLKQDFIDQLERVDETLERLDSRVTYLNKIASALLEYQSGEETEKQVARTILEAYSIPLTTSPDEINKEVFEVMVERQGLADKLENISREYQRYADLNQEARVREYEQEEMDKEI